MAQFTQRNGADEVDAALLERASGFTRRRLFGAAAANVAEGYLELFGFERSLTNMRKVIARTTRQTGIEKTAVRAFRGKFPNVEFAELCKRLICWLPKLALISLALVAITGTLPYSGGVLSAQEPTGDQFADRFEDINGIHPGFRRNHAKGIGVSGFFESNGNGIRLSSAAVFKPGRVPIIGRFSLDGGRPYEADTPDTRRGLGLQFSTPNGELWRTAMINFPLFPVRTPEIFFERLLAFKQDPATGRPDPVAVKAFEERHPETVAVLKVILNEPRGSGFGNTTFFALHAFLFTNAKGKTTPVRWLLKPTQPFEAAGTAPADKNYLFHDLIGQVREQPLRWRLIVIVGKSGDLTNDPSVGWPADREQVEVGTVTIDRVQAEEDSAATDTNFDPMTLPPGMAPSDDPVLKIRSAVYARSFARRITEKKQKQPSAISRADVNKEQ